LIARGRRPQRIDVHAQRMQLQHLVVELARRPGLLSDPVEVTNILTSLLDDSRTVFVPGPLVSRNHGARLQRLDLIERGDPFASLPLAENDTERGRALNRRVEIVLVP
jgi:hypothetical protein